MSQSRTTSLTLHLNMSKQIAIVCTSADLMGDMPTGAWMEEVATPYYALKAAGVDVTIVSIKGGEVPIDQGSLAGDFNTPDCVKFAADEEAMAALKNSVKLSEEHANSLDGIYLAGGHGTCVDFVDNALLTKTIETQYAAGKPVAADCHGPIALCGCVKPDGTPLVKGLNVTCFTDTEEAAVGLTEKVSISHLPHSAPTDCPYKTNIYFISIRFLSWWRVSSENKAGFSRRRTIGTRTRAWTATW